MIKRWILNLGFVRSYVQDQIKGAEIFFHQKNFALAQKDVLETMRDDIDKQAEELAKKKLNDLLSPSDMKAIVSYNPQQGTIFIGGERADDGRLANLKSEAEYIEKTDLWHLLYETPKRLAERAMFNDDGKLENQLLKGRAILYALDTQKTILDTFKKVIGKKK